MDCNHLLIQHLTTGIDIVSKFLGLRINTTEQTADFTPTIIPASKYRSSEKLLFKPSMQLKQPTLSFCCLGIYGVIREADRRQMPGFVFGFIQGLLTTFFNTYLFISRVILVHIW